MGSDVGQIFLTASLHRDHSISYALVCEKEKSVPHDHRSFMMPIGNPRDGFFYPTLMVVFYIVQLERTSRATLQNKDPHTTKSFL